MTRFELPATNLEFILTNNGENKSVNIDLIHARMLTEENYENAPSNPDGTKKLNSAYFSSLQEKLTKHFNHPITYDQAWQFWHAIDKLWGEYKKKFDDDLRSLSITDATPSISLSENVSSSTPTSQEP